MEQESVDTLRIYEELSPSLGEDAARKLATLLGSMYIELRDVVRREDFSDLHGIVGELADSQRSTHTVVRELAEVQKRTDVKLEELAEAQKRTDVKLEELAEAQRLTEAKLEELAEAQRFTETSVRELIEAQKRTEAAVYHNSLRIDRLNKQYGGLSANLGYALENEAYRYLPNLLKNDYGLDVRGSLVRDYLSDKNGKDMEVNILGDGVLKSEQLLIVGECKSQLSKNNVDNFLRRRLRRIDTDKKVFPIMVTHMISQKDVVTYARDKGVAVYLSYQFHSEN